MVDDKAPLITDPQRLRALAHPLRNELLDVLRTEGEATATQCAERTGESVASCSFHLRMLAKYGFIESAERKGREKPWRLAVRSFTATADFEDPASMFALREVSSLVIEREAQRLRDWVGRSGEESQEWIEASTLATSAFWATAEEMAEVSRAIAELTDRFTDRFDDPSRRPDGARMVRMFGATSVDAVRPSDEGARVTGADS
jgi:DNA-binding transcriptional ArsR family regulator